MTICRVAMRHLLPFVRRADRGDRTLASDPPQRNLVRGDGGHEALMPCLRCGRPLTPSGRMGGRGSVRLPMMSVELLVPVLLLLVSMGTVVLAVVRTRR
jgi:hypothetical protein